MITREEWTRGYRYAREEMARIKTLLDSGMDPDSRANQLDRAGQIFGVNRLAYSRGVWAISKRNTSDPLLRKREIRRHRAIKWLHIDNR